MLIGRSCNKGLVLCATLLLIIGGCALSESRIPASAPKVQPLSGGTGKSVFVRYVRDNRMGIGNDLNTTIIGSKTIGGSPSVLGQLTGTDLYNTPGARLFVEDHKSVSALTRHLLENSLRKSGYRVVDVNNADGAIIMDAIVDKLWLSCEAGMMMNIFCTISVSVTTGSEGKSKEFDITAHQHEGYLAATDGGYTEIFHRALEEFETNATSTFNGM